MTKTEQNKLHSSKCTITPVDVQLGRGKEPRYIVALSLTPGELMAFSHMVSAPNTPTQHDILAYLNNAAERAKISL